MSSTAQKAPPLGALGSANLCVVITWNLFSQATLETVVVTTTKYKVSNVELVYGQLEYAAADAANILKESGGAFAINTFGI